MNTDLGSPYFYGDTACLLKLTHLLIWSCAAESVSSTARRRSRSSSSCSSKYLRSCFVLLCKCSVSDNLSENNQAYAKKRANSWTILFLLYSLMQYVNRLQYPSTSQRRLSYLLLLDLNYLESKREDKSLEASVSHQEVVPWLCHPWPHLLKMILKGYEESHARS